MRKIEITNVCLFSYQSHTHTHKPLVNVFLATSVGCKIEPLPRHYTRTETID